MKLQPWVETWTSEEFWDPLKKRHDLDFGPCQITLENWKQKLSGGSGASGSWDTYVQGAEYFLACFEWGSDIMEVDQIDHLDIMRHSMCQSDLDVDV